MACATAEWVGRRAGGLSLASAAFVASLTTLTLSVVELSGAPVRDVHMAVVIPVAIVTWLTAIYFIWASFSRWRWLLRTLFLCLIVWAVAIGASILIGSTTRNPELPIFGLIALAIAATIVIIVSAGHQFSRGRAVLLADGSVSVHCPACGYSMTGLDSSSCPECGKRYTLDELIRGQDYEGARPVGALKLASTSHAESSSTSTPALTTNTRTGSDRIAASARRLNTRSRH